MSNDFKVGDGVNWKAGTDTKAGTVVKVTPKQVHVVEDEGILLNGTASGESDALSFSPGGYVGHTSGKQRWNFKKGSGLVVKFTLRAKPRVESKLVETTTVIDGKEYNTKEWKDFERPNYQEVGCGSGSLWNWGRLNHGRAKHYDYNF